MSTAATPGPTFRIGIGYDSHRLAEGRRLVLGGVEIPHDRGLAGHSDADVVTHAVIDALLGAAGLGDLGSLFPPDEEQWRDADSIDMLRIAIGRLPGRPVNVDATVICEQPRLSEPPSRDGAPDLRGALGARERQGDDQRRDGGDRARRGDRVRGGAGRDVTLS